MNLIHHEPRSACRDDPARQDAGDIAGAIEVVEQLEPTMCAAVSLAGLYTRAGRWTDVVGRTEGIRNEDDASALLCVFRGAALRERGTRDAAHEAFTEAPRARSRTKQVRHLALKERAINFIAQGKNAMARKDRERIIAEDSQYAGVADLVQSLATSPG